MFQKSKKEKQQIKMLQKEQTGLLITVRLKSKMRNQQTRKRRKKSQQLLSKALLLELDQANALPYSVLMVQENQPPLTASQVMQLRLVAK